jgi:hemerythrin
MALIQWNEALSVGVTELDLQHKRLFAMINDLNDAMMQGKGKEVLSRVIVGLLDYTRTHFATEERYFERFGYPRADTHKKEHAYFTGKVAEFKDDFEQGKLGVSVKVMQFLSDWLQHHIKVADKDYGPLFNEKGLR